MGSGVCVIDYDNDGWQDVLFVNSMDWPGHGSGKSYPALYHNNRDGTFTDVTRQAGLDVEMYGLGCTVGDFDNDGFDDIYITAIGGSHLFRNLGNGHFADVTARAGPTQDFQPARSGSIMTAMGAWIYLLRTTWNGRWRPTSPASSMGSISPIAPLRLTMARARASFTISATAALKM